MFYRLFPVPNGVKTQSIDDICVYFHTTTQLLQLPAAPWMSFCPYMQSIRATHPDDQIHVNFQCYSPHSIHLFHQFLQNGLAYAPDPDATVSYQRPSQIPELTEDELLDFLAIVRDLGAAVRGNKIKKTEKIVYPASSSSRNLPKLVPRRLCHLCTTIKEHQATILHPTPSQVVSIQSTSSNWTISSCPCKRTQAHESLFSQVYEQPESMLKLRGVQPVENDESDPLLTGVLTEQENAIDLPPNDQEFPWGAYFDIKHSLSLLKSLKLGRLPFLTIHNISAIFVRAPADTSSARPSHYCILCGVSVCRKEELFHHIQAHHSGFVARCNRCGQLCSTERQALSHVKRKHRVPVSVTPLSCSGHRQMYTPDTHRVGRLMASKSYDNLYVRLTMQGKWSKKSSTASFDSVNAQSTPSLSIEDVGQPSQPIVHFLMATVDADTISILSAPVSRPEGSLNPSSLNQLANGANGQSGPIF